MRYIAYLFLIILFSSNKQEKTNALQNLARNESVQSNEISNDFKPFIKEFLKDCFSNKKMDSLIYNKSEITKKYISSKFGVRRYYNPGTTCTLEDYTENANLQKAYPNVNGYNIYNEKLQDGFCVKSKNTNGVYYNLIEKLPSYTVFEEGTYKTKALVYNNVTKQVKVTILRNNWIIKFLYFIEVDNKWSLALVDDCDCSA